MCLIAFAIDAVPGAPLVVAANRDEFHQRPSAALHRWTLDDGTEVVGGRDLREGGTWMAVTPGGRVAWLTNVRQGQPESGRRSRGELVVRWLQSSQDGRAFAQGIKAGDHGGFNLVVGDLRRGEWTWIANRDPSRPHDEQAPRLHTAPLGRGVHTVSNASLNTPWPKARRLCAALSDALRSGPVGGTAWPGALATTLTDTRIAPDDELPRTGVPLAAERSLSSPFVRMPDRGYGTRCSTLLTWHADGTLDLEEWSHDPGRTLPALDPAFHRRERLTVA